MNEPRRVTLTDFLHLRKGGEKTATFLLKISNVSQPTSGHLYCLGSLELRLRQNAFKVVEFQRKRLESVEKSVLFRRNE